MSPGDYTVPVSTSGVKRRGRKGVVEDGRRRWGESFIWDSCASVGASSVSQGGCHRRIAASPSAQEGGPASAAYAGVFRGHPSRW